MIVPGNAEALRAMGFRALSYGFPLLTIPAFAGALSSAEYGRLGLALTFCSLLQAVSEGGHSIGGARWLINASADRHASIVATIYEQKVLLLALCLVMALLYYLATDASSRDVALFGVCFIAVVVPDAATPLWEFQAAGRLSELTRFQLISRAMALPIMLVGIWLWPNAFVAALLTGLPFLLCAGLTLKFTRSYLQLPGWRKPRFASLRNLSSEHLLVYAGSMASTLTPALAMQTMGRLYGVGNLGAIYLAIVLWLACRQLCGLANQSAFRRFAIRSTDEPLPLMEVLAPARWGAAIAIVGTLTTALASVVLARYGEAKYAETLRALPWMLGGLVLYSFGHALAMNRFAATGRNGTFAIVHIAAALTLSSCCVLLAPQFDRPVVLGVASLAADFVLLALTLAVRQPH